MRLIDADALKEKKVYSQERHENIVPVAEIDWLPTIDAVPIKFIDEVIEYLEKCHDYAIHEETKTAWNDEAVALIMLLHEWDAWNECGRTGKYGERGANDGTD